MSKIPELKPCPFCSGRADYVRCSFADVMQPQWRVFCTRCQVRQLKFPSRPKAAIAWNRRASL